MRRLREVLIPSFPRQYSEVDGVRSRSVRKQRPRRRVRVVDQLARLGLGYDGRRGGNLLLLGVLLCIRRGHVATQMGDITLDTGTSAVDQAVSADNVTHQRSQGRPPSHTMCLLTASALSRGGAGQLYYSRAATVNASLASLAFLLLLRVAFLAVLVPLDGVDVWRDGTRRGRTRHGRLPLVLLLRVVVLLVMVLLWLVHLDGAHLLLLLLVREHVGNGCGMRCGSVVGHERQAEGVEGVDGE